LTVNQLVAGSSPARGANYPSFYVNHLSMVFFEELNQIGR